MRVALIAAIASNGVVGRNNELPWRLAEDLKYFKRTTLGKPVVMGRRTWDSIGRPLPGRSNIVISRQQGLEIEGAQVVPDVASALRVASEIAELEGADEVMVIGGAEIYAAALPLAARLYITEVQAEVEGDAFFPAWNREAWYEISRVSHQASDNNGYDYSFVVYERTAVVT